MGSFSHLQSFNALDEGKILDFDSVPDTLTKKAKPELPFSGDSRYLTRLCVFGNEAQLSQSESAQPIITSGFELRDDNINTHNKIIQDKIIAVLKLLTFREQHVLVQFWSPAHVVGKHQVLTTMDQPFGLGETTEQLTSYRKESQHNLYVVDDDHEEEELSPPARVFRQRLPEWTPDVANYSSKQFPQKESAIHRDLHGYLALPVVDLSTSSCVGVLEILTSSKYISYEYEIQQVQRALKTANLIIVQEFDGPTMHVHNAQNELERIHDVLKFVCAAYQLPLAQTWATDPLTTFASHDQVLKKGCSSFHTRCLGKVCMSTAYLPYYVQDLRLWSFRKACKEQHLDKSCGFVGRALLSHGSCFCEDVTKLSQEEYPLVHYAHINGITSCFAIYLRSVESNVDYVLEFFLPKNIEEGRHVQNLVQTLKQHIEMASVFELGDKSLIQVVGPSIEASSVFSNTGPQSNNVIRDDIDVVDAGNEVKATSNHDVSMQIARNAVTGAREESNRLKRGRKREIDSLTMEEVKKHVGKPIDEAAKSLGVHRSTLKHFCQDHNMTSFPLPKHKTAHFIDSKLSRIQPLQGSSSWNCSSKNHGFSIKGNRDHLTDRTEKPKFKTNIPKQIVARATSDIRKVTVKATFKEDILKFQLPTSSGMFELENEVAQRIKLQNKRLCLKYMDEEDDMILLACDADLHHLLGFSISNNCILKLSIQLVDE